MTVIFFDRLTKKNWFSFYTKPQLTHGVKRLFEKVPGCDRTKGDKE